MSRNRVLGGQKLRQRQVGLNLRAKKRDTGSWEVEEDLLSNQNSRRTAGAKGRIEVLEDQLGELNTELASRNMKIEDLNTKLADLKEEYDRTIEGREQVEKEYDLVYMRARKEAEANVKILVKDELRKEHRALKEKVVALSEALADSEAENKRMAFSSEQEKKAQQEQFELLVNKISKKDQQEAKANVDAASLAASQAATAVAHVMQEQSKVRNAAYDMKLQSLEAKKAMAKMKQQIEELQKECVEMKLAVREKERELAGASKERALLERKADDRISKAEASALASVDAMQKAMEEIKASMEERVRAAENSSNQKQGQIEELLNEVSHLRDEMGKKTLESIEYQSKVHALEESMTAHKDLIGQELQAHISSYKNEVESVRKATKAETLQEHFEKQRDILDIQSSKHKLQVEKFRTGERFTNNIIKHLQSECQYWQERARSSELLLKYLEEDEPRPDRVQRKTLSLCGKDIRSFLLSGPYSQSTGGETSEPFKSTWKHTPDKGENLSYRPE